MQQGICNPDFYGDLVYKFKKIIENPNKNIIMSSFKSSGDIHKKEGGPDSCFG